MSQIARTVQAIARRADRAYQLEQLRQRVDQLEAQLAEAQDVHTGDVDAYERRLAGTYQPRDETKL